MSEKIENLLNVALEANIQELDKSRELSAGFNPIDNSWDLIIRFTGTPDFLEKYNEIQYEILSNNFAILSVPKETIDKLAEDDSVIYIEKAKPLYFAVINNRSEACVTNAQNQFGIYGEGVIIAVIDSGIDYANSAFIDEFGKTRIIEIWDQTIGNGENTYGFNRGTFYTDSQINAAINAPDFRERYEIVPSRDYSGHGTHVAGIAAGNFANDKRNNIGIATKSKLLIVKLATPRENSFPTTIELMEAIDYVTKKAEELKMPLVINLSFGNNYGSHDGTSLLETYINEISAKERISVVIGSGNEGNAGGHTSGKIDTGETENIEFAVSNYQNSLNLQIWKSYADIFEIELISPTGESTGIFTDANEVMKYNVSSDRTRLMVYYGTPKPYSIYQEVYVQFVPEDMYIQSGIWTVRITSVKSVVGEYNMWLPVEASLGTNTRFLNPVPDTTLTIPSTASKAITVGAYDSNRQTYADFSGRGFTRETNQIKPDIVAPGVDIISAAVGGGLSVKSGTSMATPFVSGAAALLMEWGIVNGNDKYLYGEKLKAYLIRGARKIDGFEKWPNPMMGWGALCIRSSIPR
ncbi:MAG: S8 family peptidase [Eubacterium sp.]|uniref:S8 family peptidase n=1 Tax=Eubacterium sp. TaxID=142586 RepID=UPI00300F2BCC